MAFLPIPAAWIEAGKPTKEEIFQYLVDNQESFNADIELLKQTSRISIFNTRIHGSFREYSEAQLLEILPVFRAMATGFITEVRLAQLGTDATGTFTVQFDKSIDGGSSWLPILSTPVVLTLGSPGNSSTGVNFVTGGENFNQNDMIRVRLLGSSGTPESFHINVYGELA